MLTCEQFSDFVAEVHGGRRPFPWQSALLRRLTTGEDWPAVIDVPTGLGKTSVLDIAVFAAAMGLPAARRRICYVVDRRLVVDEAWEHAQRLAEALSAPGDRPVLAAVAQRLLNAGDDTVLDVTRMRGGVTWERNWLERPDRYAIVTGTVDQVGSRLLFRGYGVSEHARSIDAALIGTDSLIIVDEAHLAPAFTRTAKAAMAMDHSPLTRQPQFVVMSATSDRDADERTVHRITELDEQHEIAGARLHAAKRLHLIEVKATKANADTVLAQAMADLADTLAPGRVVGVVTNTVARARAVFSLLRETHDTVLLTGRSRQVDRDHLLAQYYQHIRVDRVREGQRPIIVVATQTVEVGANIDFDALITDSAPLSSLVQRLGRLNRVAAPRIAGTPYAPAIVVHDSTAGPDDPVYGPARLATWNWLSAWTSPTRYRPPIDPAQLPDGLNASPAALRGLVATMSDDDRIAVRAPTPYVPVLHHAHLDSWARTSPAPEPDQPIEPFLHGVRDDALPVSVVWRYDLGDPSGWIALIDELPPVAEEAIDVSVGAVRRWLRSRDFDSTASDLDATPTDADPATATGPPAVPLVLRYRRRGDAELILPWQVRPGDTIVVPAEAGGCDDYGWYPTSSSPVLDVADLALRRGRPVLRLGPTLRHAVARSNADLAPRVQELIDKASQDADAGNSHPSTDGYRKLLSAIRIPTIQPPLAPVLDALLRPGLRATIRPQMEEQPSRRTHYGLLTVQAGQLGDDDTPLGSSARSPDPVGLDEHQNAVARRAHEFATTLDLPPRVVASVTRAALLHDEGKRDPRFQVMLWNGDHAAAEIAEYPLAKSAIDATDRAAFTRARRSAGYPSNMRHEALSAQIAAARIHADSDLDHDLVVHLVASHHGNARPLLPPITDPNPLKVNVDGMGIFDSSATIDWQQPQRFAELNATYGRWGLALLETIVRLADIWCSVRNETSQESP